MQRTTGLKILLGLVAGAALAAILFRATGRAPHVAAPAAEERPAAPAAPTVATAPAPTPPTPPRVAQPPGPEQAPSTTAAPPPPGSEGERLNEGVLMARLRSVAGSDFPLAVELARAGNRRFPDSSDAPERASILIHALASEGQARDARAEAEYAVNHYPDSTWVREIEGFTGAHRHRNLILTDGGVIQTQ